MTKLRTGAGSAPYLYIYTVFYAILESGAQRLEDAACTQKTLDLFACAEAAGADVGIALQVYPRRTYDDIVPLQLRTSRLRICKGIYAEAQAHLVPSASPDRSAINEHFVRHVSSALQTGSFVGIATHDETLIDALIAWLRHEQIEPGRFEFPMLLGGVCESLRERLRAMGFQVRVIGCKTPRNQPHRSEVVT